MSRGEVSTMVSGNKISKKRELDLSLTTFRRRPLYYLDRAYETQEPIFIYNRKKLVGIIWKSYGPKKLKSKIKHWGAVLGAMEVHMAGKGHDLRAQLGLPPAKAGGGKTRKRAGPLRKPKRP